MVKLLLYHGLAIGYYIYECVGESLILAGDICEFTMLDGEIITGVINLILPADSEITMVKGLPPVVLYEDSLIVNGILISFYFADKVKVLERGSSHKSLCVFMGKL